MSSGSDPGMRRMGDFRTRMIHLDAGQPRDREANFGTMALVLGSLHEKVADAQQVPFEALFVAHYRAIREIGRTATEPGVAVVAVHIPTCRLTGRAWLAARPSGVRSAVVGRHSEADLLLPDPGLSLRHLAVVVPPPASWDAGAIGFEVLDLRTSQAFRDERGRHLDGVLAEGPVFLSCGPYALFFLQTGDPSDWPELATDAWSMLPERVYLDERAAEPDRWRRGAHSVRSSARESRPDRSSITAIPALLSADDRLLLEGERALGTLLVASERGVRRLPLGSSAATRGILLGRYPRCESSEILADVHISRAHVLVKRAGGRLWAIDTASSEGMFAAGHPSSRARVLPLDGGEEVWIGQHRATLRWEAVRG